MTLQEMVQEMVKQTGCTPEEATAALRVELIRFAAAFGAITVDEANARLAPAGLKIRKVVR